jgi:23S rRNA (guanine745-N1)-methyltransferase
MPHGTRHQKADWPASFPRVALAAVRCPICRTRFEQHDRVLRCVNGHSFDVARQGYVNLLGSGAGDNKDMVAARAEFFAAGHFTPLARLVASESARELPRDGLVIDAGTGTGYYLAAVLTRVPAATGLGMDTSTAALRRAARAHPRIGAITWDLWQAWPLASQSADVILNIFAPRNPAESNRVLRPDGTLLVVTPSASHLAELRAYVDILAVDEDKLTRLDSSLRDFTLARRHDCETELTLQPQDVHRIVSMGPNAHHVSQAALAAIREPITVTAAFVVSVYRKLAEP